MTDIASVVFLPSEPTFIYRETGKGVVIDPHSKGISGLQPVVGGRVVYLSGEKFKTLPEGT